MTNRQIGENFLSKVYTAYKVWTPSWYSIGATKPAFPFKTSAEFIAAIDKLAPAFLIGNVQKAGWIENWGNTLNKLGLSSDVQNKIAADAVNASSGKYPLKSNDLSYFSEAAIKNVSGFKVIALETVTKTMEQAKTAAKTVAAVAGIGASIYIIAIGAIGIIALMRFMPKKRIN